MKKYVVIFLIAFVPYMHAQDEEPDGFEQRVKFFPLPVFGLLNVEYEIAPNDSWRFNVRTHHIGISDLLYFEVGVGCSYFFNLNEEHSIYLGYDYNHYHWAIYEESWVEKEYGFVGHFTVGWEWQFREEWCFGIEYGPPIGGQETIKTPLNEEYKFPYYVVFIYLGFTF